MEKFYMTEEETKKMQELTRLDAEMILEEMRLEDLWRLGNFLAYNSSDALTCMIYEIYSERYRKEARYECNI